MSLKHHLMLSYLQAATLLVAHRGLGHSLVDRSPINVSFASSSRPARGDRAGDLVDYMVEGRLVLEKIKILEGRMKYQIEKLARAAIEKQDSTNGKDKIILSSMRVNVAPCPQTHYSSGPTRRTSRIFPISLTLKEIKTTGSIDLQRLLPCHITNQVQRKIVVYPSQLH